MIHLSGVRCEYPGVPEPVVALDDVNLTIPKGQFVAVIGPNGSGKSTFVRLLNALVLPVAGSVNVDGMDTTDPGAIWTIRTHVGMVFSNPENQILAPTVEQDVAFGLENVGVPRDEMRLRVTAALRQVGLAGFEGREPDLLSGGERQRVAIAGVLAMEPDYVVLDEAANMLDSLSRRKVMNTLLDLNDRGVTIICVTHSVAEAVLADRVIVFSDGRVALDGSPRELCSDPDMWSALDIPPPPAAAVARQLRRLGLDLESIPIEGEELAAMINTSTRPLTSREDK